ncbi:MAG: hypothetical protein V4629_03275 [Pseudomonadota bacterium]
MNISTERKSGYTMEEMDAILEANNESIPEENMDDLMRGAQHLNEKINCFLAGLALGAASIVFVATYIFPIQM